ncbi:MAG: hypothetical protein WC055_00045 [Melioribacteraceae bacterium]
MNDLTPEEVLAMKGTEFIYIDIYGVSVSAFVAQVQLGKGLTCKALSSEWSNGDRVYLGEGSYHHSDKL